MTKAIILYHTNESPPSRAVRLTAAALGVPLQLVIVNPIAGEHKTPEFLKLNPQHTIPTIDDNGVVIADSHAISAYLVGKFGKDDSLYPKDLAKRALVDSRLHFDSGHLFCRIRFLLEPIFYYKCKELPEEKIKYIQNLWSIIERFLESSPYIAGDTLTIADLCVLASVTSINEIATINPAAYPKLLQWIDRMSRLPYYKETNEAGAKNLQAFVRKMVKVNAAL